MRFSSGMLGALIITMALMGTILLGFMGSIEKVNSTSIQYDYLTDATSLFDYSTDPEFVDYSPNANYTHYTTDPDTALTGSGATFYTSGIDYTATAGNLVNPYRVYTQLGDDVQTLTLTSSLPLMSGSGNASHYVHLDGYIHYLSGGKYSLFSTAYVTGANVVTLANVINASTISEGSHLHTFTVENWNTGESPWIIYGDNIRWENFTVNNTTYLKETILRAGEIRTDLGADSNVYVVWDDEANLATVYRGDGLNLYSGSTSNVAFIFGGTNPVYGGLTPGTKVTVTTALEQAPTYMDISQGVSFNADTVYWGNGYGVGKLSLLVKTPATASNLSIYAIDGSKTILNTVKLTHDASGFSIGAWDAALLTIDYTQGTYTLSGVQNPVSFTDYTVSSYSQTYPITGFSSSDQEIPKALIFSSVAEEWMVSINNTTVYLNTASQVMRDPSINLDGFFLNEENLRLTFGAFAYYGDSITINSTTYDVTDGKITVYADERTRHYDLSNVMITWEGGETLLTFKNTKATVNLGAYTEKSVQLAGNWYFSSSVYEGKVKDTSHWDYQFGWELSQSAFLLVFIAILGIAAAVIHTKRGLTRIDIIALILAGFTAYILLG